MNPKQKCPTCQTTIPLDGSTGGLCPKCLLNEGLEKDAAGPGFDETLDSSPSTKVIATAAVGKTFGDYELIDEIARGGMGVVYKAKHSQLNRVVALKMILSGEFASESDIRRFQQEAESAANLDHSGIVPIYEIGEHDGHHFFSMKLVEGGNLADALPELQKDVRATVKLFVGIAQAVHHAHQRGILHRDLKPANILLDEDRNPLVSDLGLAKQIQSDSNITNTGVVVGTPAYMPPEQATAEKEITTAADIYSIGAMFYEALTGEPPHIADSPVATLMCVINDDITPPREHDKKINRVLELICMKCLERDQSKRYSSAAALADDLVAWLDGKPVSVRRPSRGLAVVGALRANLKTAVGAAIIGMVAGYLFAFFLSKCTNDGSVVRNPPTKIYDALPGAIPIGRDLAFMKEDPHSRSESLFGTLGSVAIVCYVGLVVVVVTRPKPGSEAVALGMVAGLLMSITMFTLQIGFAGVKESHGYVRREVNVLAEVAIGTKEQSTAAQKTLFEKYPGLSNLPADERASTLAYRIFYDGLYQVPLSIISGILVVAVLCMLPCMAGTAFASKLLHERGRLRWSLPAYTEFGCLILVLSILLFLQTIIPFVGGNVPNFGFIGRYDRQVVVYSFLTIMAILIYRRTMRWWWRLLIYVVFVVGCGTFL